LLTVSDIPDEFRKGKSDGENIARLASGVQNALDQALGPAGSDAGLRYVQAGFLFRSSEIGRTMSNSNVSLGEPLGEDPQLVDFAGGALAATSLAGAVNLAAAAIYRLYFGEVDSNDPAGKLTSMTFRTKPRCQTRCVTGSRSSQDVLS
jgi:hypothetical protein